MKYLKDMKVAELRKELERRDMAADGLKVVLRERLRERLQSNENTFPSANNTLRRVVTVEYALGADGKRDYNELCVRIPTSRSHLDAFVIEADDANVDYESDVVHVSYGLHLMLDIAHSKFLKVDQIQTLLVPDFSFVDYDSLSKESMTEAFKDLTALKEIIYYNDARPLGPADEVYGDYKNEYRGYDIEVLSSADHLASEPVNWIRSCWAEQHYVQHYGTDYKELFLDTMSGTDDKDALREQFKDVEAYFTTFEYDLILL